MTLFKEIQLSAGLYDAHLMCFLFMSHWLKVLNSKQFTTVVRIKPAVVNISSGRLLVALTFLIEAKNQKKLEIFILPGLRIE